jgi:hypothetical protein
MTDAPSNAAAGSPAGSKPPNKDNGAQTAKAEKRIAVVFIHGQGEQRPMEDVKEFARTVWEADPKRKRDISKDITAGPGAPPPAPESPRAGELAEQETPKTWHIPDETLDLADLGRVTTEARQHDLRVDFYELYWAHLMGGNQLSHLADWFRALQKRPRKHAPEALAPLRQATIRFTESLALLAILKTGLTALMIPPGAAGLAWQPLVVDLSPLAAWIALPPYQFFVPGPHDAIWLWTLGLFAALGFALLRLAVNEVAGGHSPSTAAGDRKKIEGRNTRGAIMRGLLPIAGVVAGLVLGTLVLQGPTLDWADARLPLLVMAVAAATLMAFRAIEAAAIVGLVGAGLAAIAAMVGGVSAHGVIAFNAAARAPSWLAEIPHGAASARLLPSYAESVGVGALGIAVFAVLWFIASLFKEIGASRHGWVRGLVMLVLLALSAGGTVLALQWGLADQPRLWAIYGLGVTIAAVSVAGVVMLALASKAFLVPVMADSARYFSREPAHIGARQRIRQAGVRLLDKLHERAPSEGGYSRIIVVAHSLGSAVGYELLVDYWGRRTGALPISDPVLKACIAELESAAHKLNRAASADLPKALSAYRDRQADLQRRLAEHAAAVYDHSREDGRRRMRTPARPIKEGEDADAAPRHWLISDFITLGSPLTYASLLMTEGPDNLHDKMADRTFATCPPTPFAPGNTAMTYRKVGSPELTPSAEPGRITFEGWDGEPRLAHHAVFAPVRWTNHFFPVEGWIAKGDAIGGPLSPVSTDLLSTTGAASFGNRQLNQTDQGVIGRGVREKPLIRKHTGKTFAHNEYWRTPLRTQQLRAELAKAAPWPMHIAALIDSLNLDETLEKAAAPKPDQA